MHAVACAHLSALKLPLCHLGWQHVLPGVQHLVNRHALQQAADLNDVFIPEQQQRVKQQQR